MAPTTLPQGSNALVRTASPVESPQWQGISIRRARGLLFFVTITPIGFVMRLFGKDFLRLRMDRRAPSYWIDRQPPGPPPQSMKNQF